MSDLIVDSVPAVLPRLRMSYEEFLEWSGDETHAEWVDGEVIVFMPPKQTHQLIVGLFYNVLTRLMEIDDLGSALMAPFEMKLFDGSAREPDVLFLKREHFDRQTEARWLGPADWVLEVLSDSKESYDRGARFAAYERAGVPEYWMADPRPGGEPLRAFALGNDGRYERISPDARGRIHSRVISGFWFSPGWLRQYPLPKVDRLLRVMAPEAYRAYLVRTLEEDAVADSGENDVGPDRSL